MKFAPKLSFIAVIMFSRGAGFRGVEMWRGVIGTWLSFWRYSICLKKIQVQCTLNNKIIVDRESSATKPIEMIIAQAFSYYPMKDTHKSKLSYCLQCHTSYCLLLHSCNTSWSGSDSLNTNVHHLATQVIMTIVQQNKSTWVWQNCTEKLLQMHSGMVR